MRHVRQQAIRVGLLLLLAGLMAVDRLPSASGSTVPPAYLDFSVLDFDSYRVTWSLKVVIDGLVKSPVLAVQVGNSVVFRYDARYDRSLDTTTIEECLPSNFTGVYGQFPRERRVLVLYFAINASLVNPPTGAVLKLPTQNYIGLSSVSLTRNMADWAVRDENPLLNQYGEVYHLSLQIERSVDMANFLTLAMVSIPNILDLIFWVLVLIVPLHFGFWIGSRWHKVPRRDLLDTNYFAIVVGIVFFLPIYMLSLRPMLAPLSLTEADSYLFRLIESFAKLMIVAFGVYLLTNKIARHSNSANSEKASKDAATQEKRPKRQLDKGTIENARVGYQAAVHLHNYEGSMVWARFNVMMAANSIVIGATVLVLTRIPQLRVLAWALPIVGFALCITWIILTWGGMEYFRYLTSSARELEEQYLNPPVKTLSRGATFEDSEPITLMIGGKPETVRQSSFLHWRNFERIFYAIIVVFMAAYVAIILQVILDQL